MSRLTDYFKGYPCALPPHLRERTHNDWFIGKWIPRSWNAMGPRCKPGSLGYEPWPPKLVGGYDVTRWENSGASSILWIEGFQNKHITADDIYGQNLTAWEMNPSHKNFARQVVVYFPEWRKNEVTDIQDGPDHFHQIVQPNDYSPSSLQKFSFDRGYLRLTCGYYSWWKILKKKEWPWQRKQMSPDLEDMVAFMRRGPRPDHVDCYYNKDRIGYYGLKWE